MHTILEAIATENPPFEVSQAQSVKFMSQMTAIAPSLRDRATKIYAKSGIDRRYTCISDYLSEPAAFQFYPQNWQLEPQPSSFERNQLYDHYAIKISISAARQAMQQTQLSPDEITHLIIVSCTGFTAPGLDVQLIQQLGLRPDIDRTLIGFMGCYAAFNGLKTAHALCQSQPQARVLMICVELCTLHFQAENTLESVVINALFGDGAAAAILSARAPEEAVGKLAYIDGYSFLISDTRDLMSWTIGNTGFLMSLSPRVPQAIAQHLPDYLNTFLHRHNLQTEDIDAWAIHPGGRQIVDQVQICLELDPQLMWDSYEVLRQYGNMSSCTILFILKRLIERYQSKLKATRREANTTDKIEDQIKPKNEHDIENILALAFGPGLTIEGGLFQPVQACSR